MSSPQKTARLAGALYLLSAIAAGVPILYVNGNLIEYGNAAATARNILSSEFPFRLSICSELAGAIIFLLMVGALYRLLNGVNQTQASLMVTLVLASIPITFANVLNELVALSLLHGANFLLVFNQNQRVALALLFLGLHGDGVHLANIFWGLWLFPFGILVFRSGFIPKILGALLIIDGFALIAVSLAALILPSYLEAANKFAIIPELGELWAMAWLLIKGVRVPHLRN
jgi:hypothetical protein